MSVGSIASLPPVIATQQTQAPVAQKPATQAAAQPISGGDSDGDNDGSGGAVNITPPVNIKA
jgi:hypothetical protein